MNDYYTKDYIRNIINDHVDPEELLQVVNDIYRYIKEKLPFRMAEPVVTALLKAYKCCGGLKALAAVGHYGGKSGLMLRTDFRNVIDEIIVQFDKHFPGHLECIKTGVKTGYSISIGDLDKRIDIPLGEIMEQMIEKNLHKIEKRLERVEKRLFPLPDLPPPVCDPDRDK